MNRWNTTLCVWGKNRKNVEDNTTKNVEIISWGKKLKLLPYKCKRNRIIQVERRGSTYKTVDMARTRGTNRSLFGYRTFSDFWSFSCRPIVSPFRYSGPCAWHTSRSARSVPSSSDAWGSAPASHLYILIPFILRQFPEIQTSTRCTITIVRMNWRYSSSMPTYSGTD